MCNFESTSAFRQEPLIIPDNSENGLEVLNTKPILQCQHGHYMMALINLSLTHNLRMEFAINRLRRCGNHKGLYILRSSPKDYDKFFLSFIVGVSHFLNSCRCFSVPQSVQLCIQPFLQCKNKRWKDNAKLLASNAFINCNITRCVILLGKATAQIGCNLQ